MESRNKKPSLVAGSVEELASLGDLDYGICLRAFLTLYDLELHLIAFLKALVAFRLYSAVVDENVRSTFLTDESKTLSVVKPFDGALILCQWSHSLAF